MLFGPWLHTWTNTASRALEDAVAAPAIPKLIATSHDGRKEGETPSPRRSRPQPLRALSGRPTDARKNPGVEFVFPEMMP